MEAVKRGCSLVVLHLGLRYLTTLFCCFYGISIILVNKIFLYIRLLLFYYLNLQLQEGFNYKDATYLHACMELGVDVVKKICSDWDL